MIRITPGFSIRAEFISENFIRSSGPGGQNVNKVATGVQLRFDALRCAGLPADARHRLARIAGSKFTAAGEVLIEATRFRSQKLNRDDAYRRLADIVAKSLARPRPRKKTRPSKQSREKRLESKRRHSGVKQSRAKAISGE